MKNFLHSCYGYDGSTNYILQTSTDGSTWGNNITTSFTGSNTFYDIGVANNRMIFVGNGNPYYSNDGGVNWSTNEAISAVFRSITYGNGTFLLGGPYSNSTYYSTTGGDGLTAINAFPEACYSSPTRLAYVTYID